MRVEKLGRSELTNWHLTFSRLAPVLLQLSGAGCR
jgi:hypothetical protein